jgi:hypothetical protein
MKFFARLAGDHAAHGALPAVNITVATAGKPAR